jgi:multicomponent Na+:H+ antiporter subunit E
MVGLATYVSLALLPPPRWRFRWQALPSFALFFFHQALLGGIDVAWRALHPQLPIKPGFLRHPLHLEPLAARLLMAWTVSLLPGTLSVELETDCLEIHSLNTDLPDQALAALEAKIGALFLLDPRA